MTQRLNTDATQAKYDAQLQALHRKTIVMEPGREIHSPHPLGYWSGAKEAERRYRTPLLRRLWRAIQRRLPW